MCAILGWLNPQFDLLNKQKTFQKMLKLMECRGKDSHGIYMSEHALLGHNRLAIIDLENGLQPMEFDDYIITYNGEIYNTATLRDELLANGYNFNTTCDTEVILKGYHCYKEKVLDKIEGIFAFAIYNKKDNSLFLARDRVGIKPLYYLKKKNDFIYASMLRSILASKIIEPILDKKALGEILALGPSKKLGSGIFKGIKELRAGHYLIYKNKKVKIKRYWNVVTKECNDSFIEAKHKIHDLLTDAIIRQTVSDTPIATLLSGGLDSSIITAVVAKNQHKQLTTYSIDYEENSKYFHKNNFTVDLDKKYIDIMAENFNTNHQYKVITQKDVVKFLKDALYARDYPGMTDIEASLLWFSKEISKDYKVILSGECADEVFGGYPWFYRQELNNKDYFPWINNLDYRQSLLNKKLKKKLKLKKIVRKEYKKTIKELSHSDRKDKFKKLFYINMTHFMTTLLDRKDRMTMAATLEARVPFADTKLIEYLWNLPFNYKYHRNIEKFLLREAFKKELPKEIIERKKNPYPKTHHPYFKEEVSKLLTKRLKNKNSNLAKIFDIEKIKELLDSKTDDALPWFGQLMTKPQLIAYLYQFDLWIENYHIKIKI